MSNHAAATPAAGDSLARALQLTRESLAAVQKMQEQTANLHRQFLEGQEAAQRSVQALIEQQQRLLQASLGLGTPALAAVPIPVAAVARCSCAPAAVAPPPAAVAPPTRPFLAAAAPAESTPVVPIAVSPAAPPVPPSAPTVAVAPSSRIERILLEVVAEKTGYPAEMLDPDMALDADLGIDSIKRVEILSALQERLPEAPAVKPEHLGSLHTLGDIAAFLAGGKAAPSPAPATP